MHWQWGDGNSLVAVNESLSLLLQQRKKVKEMTVKECVKCNLKLICIINLYFNKIS